MKKKKTNELVCPSSTFSGGSWSACASTLLPIKRTRTSTPRIRGLVLLKWIYLSTGRKKGAEFPFIANEHGEKKHNSFFGLKMFDYMHFISRPSRFIHLHVVVSTFLMRPHGHTRHSEMHVTASSSDAPAAPLWEAGNLSHSTCITAKLGSVTFCCHHHTFAVTRLRAGQLSPLIA